ncbi:MAG: hypothetical protein GY795_37150 [Desulfobacterales bacterium]|nr:hypothetical protein [Desulfobacterales bacterium]
MQIIVPKEDEELTLMNPKHPACSLLIQLQNDTKHDVPRDNIHARIDVSPHHEADNTHSVHCEYLKKMIQNQIDESLYKTQKSGFFRKTPDIKAGDIFDINIELTPLIRQTFFQSANHFFDVTISINKNIERRFVLRWLPVYTEIEPSDPNKETVMERLIHESGLAVINNNPSVEEKLKLRLDYDPAKNRWTDLKSGTVNMNISVSSDDDIQSDIIGRIKNAFDADSLVVEPDKKPGSAFLFIPFRYIDDIRQSGDFRFRISVELTTKKHTFAGSESLSCEIPAIFRQSQPFPGHAALDFGTTNSACVYFDPRKGRPTFPDKFFSPLQRKSLQKTIDDLMMTLEEKSLQNEKPYKILEKCFIDAARDMWRDSYGGRSKTLDDIRAYFKKLHQSEDETAISKMRADLIVLWAIKGYRNSRKKYEESKASVDKETASLLTELYYKCLNSIIDIDIQEDCQIFLPELEEGDVEGKISSTIRMDKLAEKDKKQNYPTIDPFHSQIRMGTAIEETLREADYRSSGENRETLDRRGDQDTIHDVFVTGTKRWIGHSDNAYFIDMKNKVFRDTYDSICTSGIKHLLFKAEQSFSNNREYLNDLVVTYPANLSQHRREILRQLVLSLGIRNVDMSFDEATAGALYYMWRELFSDVFAGIDGFLARSRRRVENRESPITKRIEKTDIYFQNILLYDIGGGTTDIALLEIGVEELPILQEPVSGNVGRYFIIRPKILGLTGRDNFGGDNVTLWVFRLLKSRLAEKVAANIKDKRKLSLAEQDVITEFEKDNNRFTRWLSDDTNDYGKEYENIWDDINTLVPTDFGNKPERQSAFFDLWNEAEKIKIALNTEKASPVAAASGGNLAPIISHHNLGMLEHEFNIEVKLGEVEQLILKDIIDTFVKARNLCVGQDNRRPAITHYVDRVILAGSSSHLRLVRKVMPQRELGRPFAMPGYQQKIPAPFKYDKDNLIFNPKDAKLAVARGACLPRYFKRVRVNPRDSEIQRLLKEGTSYLDFDTENVRNYIPFTIIYQTGTGESIAFEAGEKMELIRDKTRMVARKNVTYLETLFCYRIENVNQLNTGQGDYYCQFELLDAIKEHEKKSGQKLQKKTFYMEFDDDRTLCCYMYTNTDGCAGPGYLNKPARLQASEKDLFNALCQTDNSKVMWKPEATLLYSSNAIGDNTGTKIPIHEKSSRGENPEILELSIPFMNNVDFRSGETLLWQIDVSDYQVVSPEFAKLDIKLKPGNPPVLEYSVYDVDFNDPKHNTKIEPSYEETRKSLPFNPFKGDE